jgi:hypothetical protein
MVVAPPATIGTRSAGAAVDGTQPMSSSPATGLTESQWLDSAGRRAGQPIGSATKRNSAAGLTGAAGVSAVPARAAGHLAAPTAIVDDCFADESLLEGNARAQYSGLDAIVPANHTWGTVQDSAALVALSMALGGGWESLANERDKCEVIADGRRQSRRVLGRRED